MASPAHYYINSFGTESPAPETRHLDWFYVYMGLYVVQTDSIGNPTCVCFDRFNFPAAWYNFDATELAIYVKSRFKINCVHYKYSYNYIKVTVH